MASGPITSWQIDGETTETVAHFIYLDSKITVDGECSHEIKRHLLLGRKAMTNLDSILKSTDITLPTKVRLVNAMVFPVVMYGCESWTIKKAECQWVNAFKLWCWKRLESPWGSKEIKRVNPKGNIHWKDWCRSSNTFGYLIWRVNSLEKNMMLRKIEGMRRRGQQRLRWLDGFINSMDLFEQTPGDSKGWGRPECCSS